MTEGNLPRGWASAKLGDLIGVDGLFVDGDWVESKDQDPSGEVRLTQLADVGDGKWLDRSNRYMTREKAAALRCSFLEAEDVLVARMPDPLGRSCLFPGGAQPCVTVVDVAIVRPGAGSVNPRWLMHALNSPDVRAQIESMQAGTTRKRISRKNLATVQIALPPPAEQRRIAEELDRRLSHVEAAARSIRSARRRLGAARRAVLCDSLSKDWPSHWKSVTVADAGDSRLGLQRSPSRHQGSNMKQYLRVANVFEARIGLADLKEMHFTTDEAERYLLEPGDILLNEGQSPEFLGRPAMWTGQAPEMYFTNSLIRFRSGPGVLPEWALLVFRRHMHAGRFRRESRVTTNIAHLALGRFQSVEFPIPPIEEQVEILADVERRLSLIDAAERAVEDDLRKVGLLRRALLASAFSGQLVPQDTNEEPATALLKRLGADGAGKSERRRREKEKMV